MERVAERAEERTGTLPERRVILAEHGSPEFNERLLDVLRRLTRDVEAACGDNVLALILGGGYGRGEGGVLVRAGRELPYNDLDLTMVVRSRRRIPGGELDRIRGEYAREIGIHVDFSRPLTLRSVRRLPPWLMWHDLLNGHVVLSGPEDILTRNAPPSVREQVPAIEATRLLLNRGAGLLWALRVERGAERTTESDFSRRNFFKCALALGDALLIVHSRFTTRYRGRDAALEGIASSSREAAGFDDLGLYREALHFKFRPDELEGSHVDESRILRLARMWGDVLLYVESRRTGRSWSDLAEYADCGELREPEQHTVVRTLRNLVRNLQLHRISLRYPREGLYRELPVLLGLTARPVGDWEDRSARFLEVWERFN